MSMAEAEEIWQRVVAPAVDWADEFVRDEVEPIDQLWGQETFVPPDETKRKILDPLKDQVRQQELWATHLGPELGGQGYGQLKLALLNEVLGRSPWASHVFGCQAPDTGNAEIIAHYGTDEQQKRYLRPLLDAGKLAVVLEQGFQRAGDNEKLLAFGPIVLRLMAEAADLAESSEYSR